MKKPQQFKYECKVAFDINPPTAEFCSMDVENKERKCGMLHFDTFNEKFVCVLFETFKLRVVGGRVPRPKGCIKREIRSA